MKGGPLLADASTTLWVAEFPNEKPGACSTPGFRSLFARQSRPRGSTGRRRSLPRFSPTDAIGGSPRFTYCSQFGAKPEKRPRFFSSRYALVSAITTTSILAAITPHSATKRTWNIILTPSFPAFSAGHKLETASSASLFHGPVSNGRTHVLRLQARPLATSKVANSPALRKAPASVG